MSSPVTEIVPSPLDRLSQSTNRSTTTELEEEQATLWVRVDTLRAALGDHAPKTHCSDGARIPTARGSGVQRLVRNPCSEPGPDSAHWLPSVSCSAGRRRSPGIPMVRDHQQVVRLLAVGLISGVTAYILFALANPSLYRRTGGFLLIVALAAQRAPAAAADPRSRTTPPDRRHRGARIPLRLRSGPTMGRLLWFIAGVLAALTVVGVLALLSNEPERSAVATTTVPAPGHPAQAPVDTDAEDRSNLADARAREWAYLACGSACTNVDVIPRGPLWGAAVRYSNGAETCSVIDGPRRDQATRLPAEAS